MAIFEKSANFATIKSKLYTVHENYILMEMKTGLNILIIIMIGLLYRHKQENYDNDV